MKVVMTSSFDTKVVQIGFSWTNLFFTYLVPFSRGDYKYGFVQLILLGCTCWLSGLVYPFFYNKLNVKDLLSKGYKVTKVHGGDIEMAASALGLSLEYHKE